MQEDIARVSRRLDNLNEVLATVRELLEKLPDREVSSEAEELRGDMLKNRMRFAAELDFLSDEIAELRDDAVERQREELSRFYSENERVSDRLDRLDELCGSLSQAFQERAEAVSIRLNAVERQTAAVAEKTETNFHEPDSDHLLNLQNSVSDLRREIVSQGVELHDTFSSRLADIEEKLNHVASLNLDAVKNEMQEVAVELTEKIEANRKDDGLLVTRMETLEKDLPGAIDVLRYEMDHRIHVESERVLNREEQLMRVICDEVDAMIEQTLRPVSIAMELSARTGSKQIGELRDQVASSLDSARTLSDMLQTLTVRLDDMEERMARAEYAVNGRVQELENNMNALREQVARESDERVDGALASFEDSIGQIASENAERFAKFAESLDTELRNCVSLLGRRLTELEGGVALVDRRVSDMEDALVANKTEGEKLVSRVVMLEELGNKLNEKYSQNLDLLEMHTLRLEDMETHFAEQGKETQEELENRMKELEESHKSVGESLAAAVETVRGELESQASKIFGLREETEKNIEKNLAEHSRLVEGTMGEQYDEIRANLEKVDKRIRGLLGEVESLRVANQNIERSMSEKITEVDFHQFRSSQSKLWKAAAVFVCLMIPLAVFNMVSDGQPQMPVSPVIAQESVNIEIPPVPNEVVSGDASAVPVNHEIVSAEAEDVANEAASYTSSAPDVSMNDMPEPEPAFDTTPVVVHENKETPKKVESSKPEYQVYTVKKDDNLWNIAKKFYDGKGWLHKKIMEDNKLEPRHLRPGMELKIYKL